jgi:prepilin-type processing-associated H-X9-DG protein
VCQPNLRRLVLAMHQYNDAYGTLPPAYLADANGNPMHSWRVLLLPFLGPNAQQLYAQYDFSEPWDGPNNRLLAARIPEIFVCPEDRRRATCDTSYVVVTGKTTVFNGSHSMSIDQLAAMDGVSATVLVVECAASGINWMQPRDLQYDQMSFTLNDPSAKQSVRSGHAQGANVAMADGAAKRVTKRVDPHAWQGAFTADGGESPIEF